MGNDRTFAPLTTRGIPPCPPTAGPHACAWPGSERSEYNLQFSVRSVPRTVDDDLVSRLGRLGSGWYSSQPIPERLLRDLRAAPLVDESKLRVVSPRSIEHRRANAELTSRERDVLRCLAVGLSLSGAGDALGISRLTARTHADNARAILSGKNIIHTVAIAIREGHI
jgi:DNA-binding CsgD family transcriptional regulator